MDMSGVDIGGIKYIIPYKGTRDNALQICEYIENIRNTNRLDIPWEYR